MAGSPSPRASTSPTSWTTSAAIGTVLEVVPGPESLRWFGTGPHETYPDRKRAGLVGRWSLDGHRPVRPVHPAPGERRSRRRALAGARRGGSRSRPPHRPRTRRARSPSPTTALPTWRPRPTTWTCVPSPRRSSTSTPPIAAWAPPAAARTRCPSTGSRPAGTSWSLDPARHPGRLTRAGQLGAGDPHLPPPQRPGQLRHAGPRRREPRPPAFRRRRWRTAGSSPRSSPAASPASRTASATRSALEYPTTGSGDFRIPALTVEHADGSTILALRLRRRTGSCPASRVGRTATCRRPTSRTTRRPTRSRSRSRTGSSGLAVDLAYTIFRDHPAIARSARIRNDGRDAGPADRRDERRARPARRALAVPPAERHVERARTTSSNAGSGPGASRSAATGASPATSTTRSSRCVARRRPRTPARSTGSASSTRATSSPRPRSTPFETTRVRLGISPETFTWTLEPGAAFVSPEAVLVYSDAGLGAMSDAYHGLYRDRLARGAWRDAPARSSSTTGRRPTSASTRPSCSRSRRPPATSASSCSSSTTAGSASATRTTRRSATGSSIGASSRTASTASRPGSRRSA